MIHAGGVDVRLRRAAAQILEATELLLGALDGQDAQEHYAAVVAEAEQLAASRLAQRARRAQLRVINGGVR